MTQYQVWLNGLSLQDVDPSIRITDVQELAPSQLTATTAMAMGDGLRLLRRNRQSMSVAVCLIIREYSMSRRKAALAAVLAWARQGGWLSLGDRPGQRLNVIADALPSLTSALRWTEILTLRFTAYEAPFWEEAAPTCILPGRKVHLPGNGPAAPVDFCWETPGGNVSLCIQTPLSRIHLDSLPTSPGQQLGMAHMGGVPIITLDGKDMLVYRTADSSDDLLLASGETSIVEATANGAPIQNITLMARGRWL